MQSPVIMPTEPHRKIIDVTKQGPVRTVTEKPALQKNKSQ